MFSNFGAGDASLSFLSGIGSGGVVQSNAFGSFYDNTTQTTAGNENIVMNFNNIDTSSTYGFSIQNDNFGFPNKIVASISGLYNIQFSAQLLKTGGSGASNVYIWFSKQGSFVQDSNTVVTLTNNGDLLVAAWNYFIPLNAGEYFQLYWRSNNSNVELHYNATPIVGIPEIPSIILTVQKIAEI